MDPTALDAAATARIHEALAEQQLDGSYAAFVVQHLALPDATWRWCCGSMCDPCVQRLGRAVDRVRADLGIPPPN